MKQPLVLVAVCLVVGMILGFRLGAGDVLLPINGVCVALLAVGLCLFRVPHMEVTQSVSLLVAFVAVGALRMGITLRNTDVPLPDEAGEYSAVVAATPENRGHVVRVDVIITDGLLAGRKVRLSMLDNNSLTLKVNEGLQFRGRLRKPVSFDSPSSFDYPLYMKVHGFAGVGLVYPSSWERAEVSFRELSLWERARLVALGWRESIIRHYVETCSGGEDELAVMLAVTLGYKGALSNELRNDYAVAGVSHALALSGMHLGILYFFLSLVLSPSWGRRISGRRSNVKHARNVWREAIIISTVLIFVVMVGLPPSAVRAGLMITLLAATDIASRGTVIVHKHDYDGNRFLNVSGVSGSSSLNSIAVSAIIMLMISPLSLFDVGWQLSFVAVISIIIAMGLVPYHLKGNKVVSFLVVTIAAQVGTLPIVAVNFGTIPLLSIFSNVVIVLFLPLLLWLSVAMLVTMPIPVINIWVIKAMAVIAYMMNTSVTWIASLPFACIHI